VPGRRGSRRVGGRVGVCWAVLVMTLCMGSPFGRPGMYREVTSWLGILYGAMDGGRKEGAARVGGAGLFTYPSD